MSKHPHIKVNITVKDVLHTITHHIEFKADVGNRVVIGRERDLFSKAAGNCGLQHFCVVPAGVEGA